MERKSVKLLSDQVARKIAAGEVIDRPNAIIRELMDNAVDSGADKIDVEIFGGGIEKIRVIDNGSGMSKEDLLTCARPHATSKISTEEDLLKLSTLGFRGEALCSMAAVSHLQIQSSGYKMNASVTEDHIITSCSQTNGTIVETSRLFEDFPARRIFLKREASEGILCRGIFEEKVLPRPDIAFSFTQDGEQKLYLPKCNSLKERFVQTQELFENDDLFHELSNENKDEKWSFKLIIGDPEVSRSNRKNIFVYVNGRKINEYALIQAIEYGCTGYFPNGTHPVACLFVEISPELVDFNIHPAKREARFKDINSLHHGVSSTVKDFFKNYTVKNLVEIAGEDQNNLTLGFESSSIPGFDFSQESHFPKQEHTSAPSYSFSSSRTSSETSYVNNSKPSQYNDARSKFFNTAKTTSSQDLSFPGIEGRTTNFNYIPQENSSSPLDFHFIGSAMGTFLIAEKNEILYLIDQHAAHERMIYNKLLEESNQTQELLVPYTIVPESESEDKFLAEIQNSLIKCGFNCSKDENGVWNFTSVPIKWKGKEADLRRDLLDKRINPEDLMNSILASNACRSAVMDSTVLDENTAKEIAEKALELPDPHCPHGRPVFTTITKKQLFSLVKRI